MPSDAFDFIISCTFLHFLAINARMKGWYQMGKTGGGQVCTL